MKRKNNKKHFRASVALIALLLAVSISVCGCKKTPDDGIPPDDSKSNDSTQSPSVDIPTSNDGMFTDHDGKAEYDDTQSVHIQLDGDKITSSSNSVSISGSTVVLSEEATYVISGKLNDGKLIVNAKDTAKLQIVLDGVDITCSDSAAISIIEADKVFITLKDGSTNKLSNGGTFVDDDYGTDAVIFSKQDISFNGTGNLSISSPSGHGIVGKDDLVITGGTYTISSTKKGIDANDSIRIANADIKVEAGKDAIHSDNSDDTSKGFVYVESGTLDLTSSQGDGISASGYIKIDGGKFNITAGGGSKNGASHSSGSFGRPGQSTGSSSSDTDSLKGIKADGNIQINSGTFVIDSADDAVHSNSTITVSGGTFEISTGDDGIHADDTLSITDGEINVTKSYEGLEALHLLISGGTIKLVASDDGLNAAGGTDESGFGGMFGGGDQFGGGGPGGRPGGRAGGMGMGGGGAMGGAMGGSSEGTIVISGGDIYIQASGDGIDSNGTLEISGGNVTVCGPTQGDTSVLDFDLTGSITGGTFIGTGAAGMSQNFTDAEQGIIFSRTSGKAGTTITLADKSGNIIVSFTPELAFALVHISTPDLVKGETYVLTVGTSSTNVKAN